MNTEELPANWIQRQSTKRNIPYYYNTLTKESVWIHPARQGVRISSSTGTTAKTQQVVPSSSSDGARVMSVVVVPKSVNHGRTVDRKIDDSLDGKTSPRSSLHSIQANSHAISRTPAQSRLEKLQKQIKFEKAAREAADQTKSVSLTKSKTPNKSSRKDISVIAESPISSSLTKTSPQRPKKTSVITGISQQTNAKSGSPSDADLPTKKVKVALETPAEAESSSSVFTGFFAFAKNVVRTVATSFGSATDLEPRKNDNNNVRIEDKRFEFQPRSEIADNSVFRFTAAAQSPQSRLILSPTPANDRLARLRQDLVTNQQKDPKSVLTNCVDALNDDVIMTDDEDTAQSNVTNDSDDDSMDWDECLEEIELPDDQQVISPEPVMKSGICIVIDTNVLISDLHLVRSLVDATFDGPASQRPQLMVPYVVLQELDGQKQRKVQPIASQAQNAIKYIHERLKTKDKRLQGQTSKANQVAGDRLPIATNDDRILNCAIQCLDNNREVVVLSNDVNLRNLALMNELRAMSVVEMKVWLNETNA